MRLTVVGTSVIAAMAVVSAFVAGATIWLLLTDPVTVAGSLNDRGVTPFVRALADALFGALQSLLRYL